MKIYAKFIEIKHKNREKNNNLCIKILAYSANRC